MARLFEHDEDIVRERRKRFEARMQRVSRPPTPVTPIPRRASVSSPGAVRVRSRYTNFSTEFQEDDVTRLPTVPPSAIWQDEADVYERGYQLSLLPVAVPEYSPFLPSSPSIDELDTLPPTLELLHDEIPLTSAEAVQQRKGALLFPIEIDDHGRGQMYRAHVEHPTHLENVVEERADICELTTNPPPVPFQPHVVLELYNEPSYSDAVVEADTVMDDTLIVVPSLSSDNDGYSIQVEDEVDVALTLRARELLRHKGKPAFIHNPLDYIRWWLLSPGRLEFLFWLGGAMLLGILLCVVLVVTGLGLGWMSFGHLTH